jgi:hypothetical protein
MNRFWIRGDRLRENLGWRAEGGSTILEQLTKFGLAINFNAAQQIGLTIPPNMLARADKVIK